MKYRASPGRIATRAAAAIFLALLTGSFTAAQYFNMSAEHVGGNFLAGVAVRK